MTTEVTGALAPTRAVLSSGVTVLAKETRTIPAVTISAALQAGSIYDPDETLGLAHFLSRVIDRGTERRTADAIAEAFDLRGVSLGVTATRHALTLTCTCLSEDFEAVLALLADIVCHPTCLEKEILTGRGGILTTIRQDDDNPGVKAMQGVMALLYGQTHPYGRPAKGTPETVERIDRQTLLDFHRARAAPTALSVVIVGDVSPTAAVEAASRAIGDWQVELLGGPTLETPGRQPPRRRAVIPMMSKAQVDISYGFTTIARADPEYDACWLMSNILGQYGMGGRLGQSIRERQGMAYYAFCLFEANVIAGPLIVRVGVSAANVDRAVASIDEEVSKIATDGVTDTELADSKRYLIGSIPRNLETNIGIASFLQMVQQFDLGLDYEQRLPGLLGEVTREKVNAVARHTLSPDHAAVVIAGPYEEHAG